jgi:hypothetical protein
MKNILRQKLRDDLRIRGILDRYHSRINVIFELTVSFKTTCLVLACIVAYKV